MTFLSAYNKSQGILDGLKATKVWQPRLPEAPRLRADELKAWAREIFNKMPTPLPAVAHPPILHYIQILGDKYDTQSMFHVNTL